MFFGDELSSSEDSPYTFSSLRTRIAKAMEQDEGSERLHVEFQQEKDWWVHIDSDRLLRIALHYFPTTIRLRAWKVGIDGNRVEEILPVAPGVAATTATVTAMVPTVPPHLAAASAAVQVTPPPARKKTVSPKKKSTTAKHKKASGAAAPAATKGGPVSEKILLSLGELHIVGVAAPARILVAMLAGYSNPSSKTFATALSSLLQQNFVTIPSKGTLSLTAAGHTATAGKLQAGPTNNLELHARIQPLLRNPKAKDLFGILADGQPQKKRDVATSMGYSNMASKGYATSVSQLKSMGFLEEQSGWLRLTDMCFPFGRAPDATPPNNNNSSRVVKEEEHPPIKTGNESESSEYFPDDN